MQHGDFLVEIFDANGKKIGAKPRRDVDKVRDIVHCADVMVAQHGMLVLSRIPVTTLYGGLLTSTTGTMVREGETPDAAARRAMQNELGVTDVVLLHIGHDFFTYPDGVQRVKSVFAVSTNEELYPHPEDIAELAPMTRADITAAMIAAPDIFAPTFRQLWEKYGAQLPL